MSNDLRRQCSGTTREGTTCKRAPIPGALVCVIHGPSPLVRAKAQQVLDRLREPAIGHALDSMEFLASVVGNDALPTSERREAAKVQATYLRMILDRTGMGPQANLKVESLRDNLGPMTNAQLEERARVVYEQLRELNEQEARRAEAITVVPTATERKPPRQILDVSGTTYDAGPVASPAYAQVGGPFVGRPLSAEGVHAGAPGERPLAPTPEDGFPREAGPQDESK